MSRLDWFWRRLIVTKLYTQGWGKAEDMKRIFHLRKKLGKRELCRQLVPQDYPVYIDKEVVENDVRLVDGHFMSPLTPLLPDIVPKEVQVARFQMVLPAEWKSELRPLCVQMGGTGDHGFSRRKRWIAKPLLQEEGIASLILENPFYGHRRPKNQFRSSLHNVSDLFVMGGCLILESLVLFNWLEKLGYGPLGVSGISMGGHMASLGATSWHKPLSLIPCMSGSTAAGVFTHGVLSTAIPWKLLMEQYMTDDVFQREIMDLIESPEPYWTGKHDSMYKEGRKYYHDLEDSLDSDSETKASDSINIERIQNQTLACNSGDLAFGESSSLALQSNIDTSLGGSRPFHSQSGDLYKSYDMQSDQSRSQSKSCDIKVNQSASGTAELPQSAINKSSGSWIDGWTNYIPYLSSCVTGEKDAMNKQLELDCKHFMRGVMDECTHLGNFSVPVDPELIIIVLAENDEYIPSAGYLKLHELWPGSELRTMPTGHISGYFTGRKEFRKAIADSFHLHALKYFNTALRQTS